MSYPTNPKYIVLAGGLTGGPIAPLLGVVDFWRTKDKRITPVIVDVVPSFGQKLATQRNIKFFKIITGKYRRYKTWRNIFFPFWLLVGFVQAILLLQKIRPRLVLGAGGFAQLPLMYAAWVLRIPRAIHQQDVAVTLSNSLCTPIANLITTTFEFSIRDFPQESGLGSKYIKGSKVFWTGNPSMLDEHNQSGHQNSSTLKLPKNITLHQKLPVLLVFGGGGGAQGLNDLIISALPELTKVVQVIHLTGPGKMVATKNIFDNYYPMELSHDMATLYRVADVVLARAGINTLTELAEFKKPSIIVPMPNSHQELNAELLFRTKSALVLDQSMLNPEVLIKAIRKIMFDADLQKQYSQNLAKLFPAHAKEKIVEHLELLVNKNNAK